MPYTLIRGDTQSLILPCAMGGVSYVVPSGTNLLLTVKVNLTDPDSAAVCQKAYGAGLSVIGPSTIRADFVPIDFYYQTNPSFHFDVQAQEATGPIHTVVLDTITLVTDVTLLTGLSIPAYTTNPPYPAGTTLSVTGSSWFQSGNVVGQGGTLVYLSGTTIYISGGAGGGGGGITQGQLDSLSGFTIATSGALQTQIAGGGTQVRVSGSSTLSIADISGIGGVQVFTSGGRVFVSGITGTQGGGGGVTQAQLDALSGVVGATGQVLYVDLTGLSGASASTYATQVALTQTGVSLGLQTALSGSILYADLTGLSGWANTTLATVTALAATGAFLYNDLTGLSGQAASTYALITSLVSSGLLLYQDITGLSGQVSSTYATLSSLTATGVTIETQILSLSGFTLNVSGALQTLITAVSANLTQTGITLSSQIAQTGTLLFVDLTGMSGQLNTNHATVLNLALTGQTLYQDLTGLSGQAVTTYATLVNLTATGVAIEAQLAQSGSNLYVLMTGLSGQNVSTYAPLTSLTQTGVLIEAQLSSLSGFTLNASGALQALIVGGGGTAVKVTGSSALVTANFTGIGGVLVFTSGGLVFVSGGAGGGGGGVPSVNGITSAVTVVGTGTVSVTTAGSSIIVSGDPSISGYVNSVSGALQNQITGGPFPASLSMSINGGLNVVSTGVKNVFQPNVAMTILGWNIVAYQTGSILFDLQKATLTSFPSFSSMVTGGIFPSLGLANKVYSSNVTGWTVAINPGDYLQFVVSGCTGIFQVNINITGTKT